MDLVKGVVIVLLALAVFAALTIFYQQVVQPMGVLGDAAKAKLTEQAEFSDNGIYQAFSSPQQQVRALIAGLGLTEAWGVALGIMGAGMVATLLTMIALWLFRSVVS